MRNRYLYKGTLGILVFVTFLLSGCNTVKSDWEEAANKHTIEAYKGFIEKHSDESTYVQRAQKRINMLAEQRDWKNIQKTHSIESYTNFLNKYPSGLYNRQASLKLKKLKLEKAKSSNTIAAYTRFLKIYGTRKETSEVIPMLELLLYKDALLKKDIASYKKYLKFIKKGFRVKKIQDKLEPKLYNHAVSVESIDACNDYLKYFPVKKRSHAISLLKNGLEHFSKAYTIIDYEDFIKKYPQGKLADKARRMIKTIIEDRPSLSKHIKKIKIIVKESYVEDGPYLYKIEDVVRNWFHCANVEVIKDDKKEYEGVLKIVVTGVALKATYNVEVIRSIEERQGIPTGETVVLYLGASIKGKITFKILGGPRFEETFNGKKLPPKMFIKGLPCRAIDYSNCTTPYFAPFLDALRNSDFNSKLIILIRKCFGIKPLISMLLYEHYPEYLEKALVTIGKPAIKPLISALKDEDDYDRRIQTVLIKLGKPTIEPLIFSLKDENKIIRKKSAEALGRMKDTRAIESLITSLKDADYLVRRSAAWSLGEIKNYRAVCPLIVSLKDKNSYVRSEAAKALNRITGQNFYEDYKNWQRWWEENKESFWDNN